MASTMEYVHEEELALFATGEGITYIIIKERNIMQPIFETLFDIIYLAAVITLRIRVIWGYGVKTQYQLFDIMI